MGVRLADLYTGGLSIRLLNTVLIPQIVRDTSSALARSIDPDVELFDAWKTTDYLLAALVDMYGVAHFKGPKPIQRPADIVRARERRRALEEQVERVKARLAEGGQ